jgi:hypothetical protein
MPINWQYFPRSDRIPEHLRELIEVFVRHEQEIKSPDKELVSDEVLALRSISATQGKSRRAWI